MNYQFLGPDAVVYVMVIVIAVPVYFFWRWIFRNVKSSSKRGAFALFATVIFSPLFYIAGLLIFIEILEYYPDRNFDKQRWETDKNGRYKYSRDLIKSNVLMGKTKRQVIKLLGNEADSSYADELDYDIGYRPEIMSVEPSYLVINFRNNKVNAVVERDK